MKYDKKQAALKALKEMGEHAKQLKADALRRKYAPARPDDMDEAVDSAKLPSVDDVKEQLSGKQAMDSLAQQGEANEELADETLDENRKALDDLDDDKIQALLAGLKK